MALRNETGPVLAIGLAIPFWVEVLRHPAPLEWPNLVLAAACLVYASLAWLSVLGDENRAFWRGSGLATARWLPLAGFSILPALMLVIHGFGLVLVTIAVALSVVFISPELSSRSLDALAGLLGYGRSVPRSERTGASIQDLRSSWEAVRLCPPGAYVPPCWHPCLGRPSGVLSSDP